MGSGSTEAACGYRVWNLQNMQNVLAVKLFDAVRFSRIVHITIIYDVVCLFLFPIVLY